MQRVNVCALTLVGEAPLTDGSSLRSKSSYRNELSRILNPSTPFSSQNLSIA